MQIETFKVFCDLVETASFSRAATLNHVTQSAVSQQIRSLERRFHVSLIERGKKNFSVTQEGRAFLQASKEILKAYDGLSDRLRELEHVVAGPLKIAAIYSVGLHDLPPYLKKYRALFPDVNLAIDYRRSTQIYSDVLDGTADLGLVAYPQRRRGLIVESFWEDRMVLICHPGHPLAARKRVKLADLQGERFISFEPDLPTRKAIDKSLRLAGVQIKRVMELDNVETVKRAVEIENGISIIPETAAVHEVRTGLLVAKEIEAESMWRPLGVIYRRNRPISAAQRYFVEILKHPLPGVEESGFSRGRRNAVRSGLRPAPGPRLVSAG